MNIFYRVWVFLENKKNVYVFERSKRYVSKWGDKTYGYPNITCYDNLSRLSVGKYTSIASNVNILLGSNHKRGMVTNYPRSLINKNIKPQDTNERGDVTIGNDVWIGYGVTIIGPVNIGDGAIIGAGAVVVRDVPAYAVAVGVPAKVIKFRFEEGEIQDLLKIKWWERDEEEVKRMESDLFSADMQTFIDKNK